MSATHLAPLVIVAHVLLACAPRSEGPTDELGDQASSSEETTGESTPSQSSISTTSSDSTSGDSTSSDSTSSDSTSSDSTSSDSTSSDSTSSDSETTGAWADTSKVVGIAWHVAQQQEHVMEIDPFTGTLALLAALPEEYGSYAGGISAYDPLTRRMFQQSLDLLVIDADAGTLSDVLLASDLVGLDAAGEGRLLGVQAGQVVEIDAAMGTITSLAAIPEPFDSFLQGGVVFNPTTNQLYVLASAKTLLVIDASNGELVFSTQLAGEFTSCGGLQVNAAGQLIGLAGTLDARVHSVRVDPAQGTIVSLEQLPPQYDAYSGTGAIDRSQDLMIQLLPIHQILVFDASEGSLISGTEIDVGPYTNFLNVEVVY